MHVRMQTLHDLPIETFQLFDGGIIIRLLVRAKSIIQAIGFPVIVSRKFLFVPRIFIFITLTGIFLLLLLPAKPCRVRLLSVPVSLFFLLAVML